ncbi:MAG: hypothetical protein ACKVVP_16005, partial [Chloroflexota bacterium]
WPELTLSLNDGSSLIRDDLAALWWYPPERWQPGELIQLDIPGVPMRQHAGWSAQVPTPASQKLAFGELTVEIAAEPWRLKLLSSAGEILWEEAPGETVGFQSVDGIWRRARRLQSLQVLPDGSARMIAATDDPDGRTIELMVRSITVRSARFTVGVSDQQGVQRIGGTLIAAADERFVGLGERFTGVNQRGKQVDIWAEDRILAGHGESTYAPIPLLISNRGHSFLLERGERARFDLAATQPDRWSWTQQTSQAHLVMSYGASLKELVQQHALLTGLPPLPPIWAFGVIKTSLGGQESVLEEMQRLRELDVPVSAVYAYDAVDYEANIGWPYVNYAGRTSGAYPDHAGFTNQLHRLGFKALTYFKADFHLDRPGWEIPRGTRLSS